MIFAEALKDTIDNGKAVTENGAIGYAKSKSALVDFNFKVSSYRNAAESTIENDFANAYNENPLLAIKLLFLVGDVRQGMGERRVFNVCLHWLAQWHPTEAEKVLPLVAEYSRWDIVVNMLGTQVDRKAFEIIKSQLESDINSCLRQKPITLLAKWLPSINTSSKETVRKGRSLAMRLKMPERKYRQTLAMLRSYSNVVETKISANKWGEVNYEAVPSKANLIYKNAFMVHDEKRRTKYLESLKKGEAKINSSAAFPYDIVHRYNVGLGVDTVLEEMWKALPDYANGQGENTLCVVDGSGSMQSPVGSTSVTCHDVARSLGIYFAEKMPGQFHNKVITFSENPQLVNLDGMNTLREKIYEMERHCECENTNIYKTFMLVLETAVKHNLPQSELPKSILVVSDMEFDEGIDSKINGQRGYFETITDVEFDTECVTIFEEIGKKYQEAGYELPRLVFWNVCSRSGVVPMQKNEYGVALVSGFSPAIAKMVFSQKNSPYEVLLETLNSKRYEPVEKALA